MPWCPECDEVFPTGPACPRCDSFMRPDDESALPSDTERALLGQVKVPKRIQRAFDRFETPVQPPRSSAIITILLIFISGIVVGRMLSPAQLPNSDPLPADPMSAPAEMAVTYPVVMRAHGHPDLGLVRRSLADGAVSVTDRTSLPSGFTVEQLLAQPVEIRTLGGAVAVLLGAGAEGRVWASSSPGASSGWLRASSVAWANPTELIVVSGPGLASRITPSEIGSTRIDGPWVRVHQTPAGAALEGSDGTRLWVSSISDPNRRIELEAGDRVLAVDSAVRRAVVLRGGSAHLISSAGAVPIPTPRMQVLSAAFAPDSAKLAVLSRGADTDTGTLLVTDLDATPLSRSEFGALEGCESRVQWDRTSRAVVFANSHGAIALDLPGTGISETARAGAVQCSLGVSWKA